MKFAVHVTVKSLEGVQQKFFEDIEGLRIETAAQSISTEPTDYSLGGLGETECNSYELEKIFCGNWDKLLKGWLTEHPPEVDD